MKITFLNIALGMLACLMLLACEPQKNPNNPGTGDPQATDCDSSSWCGLPCTITSAENVSMSNYNNDGSNIYQASTCLLTSDTVHTDYVAQLYEPITHKLYFYTTYYVYATDFQNDKAEPYANGNHPDWVDVVAITNMFEGYPAAPYEVASTKSYGTKTSYVGYPRFQFTFTPVIVGSSNTTNYGYTPSPGEINNYGKESFDVDFSLGNYEQSSLPVMYLDGGDWYQDAQYNPGWDTRLSGKLFYTYEIEHVTTTSGKGVYFKVADDVKPASKRLCESDTKGLLEMVHYFRFPYSAFTNDSLSIVFNVDVETGSHQVAWMCTGDCGDSDDWYHNEDDDVDAIETLHYHTNVLHLSLWTSGNYNDPHQSKGNTISKVKMSSGTYEN